MSWPKILERSAVEVLLDDGRADVGRARNGRGVSEPLSYQPHHTRDDLLRLGLGFRDPVLGERDRRREGPAPRPKVLRGELLAHVLTDVAVEHRTREVARVAVGAVPEEPRGAGLHEQVL